MCVGVGIRFTPILVLVLALVLWESLFTKTTATITITTPTILLALLRLPYLSLSPSLSFQEFNARYMRMQRRESKKANVWYIMGDGSQVVGLGGLRWRCQARQMRSRQVTGVSRETSAGGRGARDFK